MFVLSDDDMEFCARTVHGAVHTAVSRFLGEKRGEETEIDKEVRLFMMDELYISPYNPWW